MTDETAGIICPECGAAARMVTDTRNYPRYIRRRRECGKCGTRITTKERIWSREEEEREIKHRTLRAVLEEIRWFVERRFEDEDDE